MVGTSGIDEKLFVPLAEFFSYETSSLEGLLTLLRSIGRPTRNLDNYSFCLGFISEAYVKWVLSRFGEIVKNFRPSGKGQGSLDHENETYSTDQWGNVTFRRNDGRLLAELDGLYEFSDDRRSVPVIVEVKQRRHPAHSGTKRIFVESLYYQEPYFCKIIHSTNNGPNWGGYPSDMPYHREIIFNRKGELKELTRHLMKEGF
jgi:hypothetical protein